MMWQRMALFLGLALSSGALGALLPPEPPPQPTCAGEMAANPALPWSTIFHDDVPPSIHPQLESIAGMGFAALQALAPPGDNLFHWTGPRDKTSQKKEVVFVFTNFATVASSAIGRELSPDSDAGTLMVGNPGDVTIYVFLFVDRLFYALGGLVERPDAFTRFQVALAHETFGNVQHFLELDLTAAPAPTEAFRFAMEIRAFEAGVAFIEHFQGLLRQNPMGGHIPQHMAAALVREKQALAVWRQRLAALTAATPTTGASH